jgi:hypothetical protein
MLNDLNSFHPNLQVIEETTKLNPPLPELTMHRTCTDVNILDFRKIRCMEVNLG